MELHYEFEKGGGGIAATIIALGYWCLYHCLMFMSTLQMDTHRRLYMDIFPVRYNSPLSLAYIAYLLCYSRALN
jgi:hypothetical protein